MTKETVKEQVHLTFNEKLLELQKRLKPIQKDSKNPHFGNRFASLNAILEEVKPHLNDLDLLLIQPIISENGVTLVGTQILDTSNTISSSIPLPQGIDPQKIGSCISYFRRYTLQSLLALETEDDDGESAVTPSINRETGEVLEKPKLKECADCGHMFVPKFDWAKQCYTCYQQSR